MIFGQIKCFKVKIVTLNFWSFFNAKAHVYEDIFYTLQSERQWMQMTQWLFASWKGYINFFTSDFSC